MSQVLPLMTPSLILVGGHSLSTQLLMDALHNKLNVSCHIESSAKLLASPVRQSKHILIIDCEQLSIQKIESIIQLTETSQGAGKIVLINTTYSNANIDWVRWGCVFGYIPTGVESKKIIMAIQHVMRNELWIPRSVLNQFFIDNRKIPLHKDRIFEELTKRELEILRMAAKGCTNPEIANRLNLSINTVKSHLHNLFKKLSVKNRVQAIDWVNSHEA